MIHQLHHNELNTQGHVLILCQKQDRKQAPWFPVVPGALCWDFFCCGGGGGIRWFTKCCHADQTFKSAMLYHWNRRVNRPANSTGGTEGSAASSITTIGDNKTSFGVAQAEDHRPQKRWRENTVASRREIAMFLLGNLILSKKGLAAHRELVSPLSSTRIIIFQLLWPQSTPVLLNSFYQPSQTLPFT